MAAIERIGILTSGGDCAGLNAVLRAVVFRATGTYGWQVIGIREGTLGLMRRPVDCEDLVPGRFTGNVLRQGGTILGTTNRGDPFAFPMPDGTTIDRTGEVIEGYRELGARRADRDRRRRQLRHIAAPRRAGRHSADRHPQDHRQ